MTATAATTSTAPAVATKDATAADVMLSEWTKVRSVRSTVWSLVLLAVSFPAFSALLVWLTVDAWPETAPEDRALVLADPAGTILASGFLVGQLAICVLGVLVITSEYSTGMIRSSLLAVPNRLKMLAAKAFVFTLLVLAVSVAAAFVAFFAGAALFADTAPVSLGDPGVLRAVVGSGMYLAMLGLFSLAIGAIVRHTAAGIAGVIGFVFMLAPLVQLLPGKVGETLYALMPTEAGALIGHVQQTSDDLLSPWQGFGVFAAWTAVLLLVAGLLLRRRDA